MGKRDADLDAEIERKLWADIRKVEQDATANVAKMVGSTAPWEERTVGDVASLDVYRGAVGLRKARETAKATVASLGVIIMQPGIQSAKDWEEAGRQLRDAGAIEALPALKKAESK